MGWRRSWIGLFLLALVAARPGFAQPAPGGGEPEVKARALFAEGRYAEALEIYVKLYSEKTHPTYLRNIGRCYQNLEQPDKAISSFREYLRQAKGLTPEQREQIEGYIHEMEELKRRQEAAGPPGAVPGAATGPGGGKSAGGEPRPSEPPPKIAPPPPTGTEPATGGEPPRADGAVWRRRVALGLGGLGVIGLGVGGWFGLDARSNWNDATSACPTPSTTGCSAQAQQSERNASRSAGVATISMTAGGVLLTSGAILWALSREHSDEHVTTGMQLVPQVGAGMVSGAIAGTF